MLHEIVVEPDEKRCLMQAHHYLGAPPKIGETHVARWRWPAFRHRRAVREMPVGIFEFSMIGCIS